MKIGLTVAAAGLVAGGVFWAVGGKSEEPAKSPEKPPAATEKKSKFDTPVWHPAARWELAEPWTGGANNCPSDLDGPRREIMYASVATGFNEGGFYAYREYAESTDRIHAVAFSSRGLLDGPFSRARCGGSGYMSNPAVNQSPDGRYAVFTDPYNGRCLRVMDFKEQMVRTVPGVPAGAQAMTADSKGQLWLFFGGGRVLVIDLGTLKTVSDLKLKATEGIDLGPSCGIALDEKKNRLYASGSTRGFKGPPDRHWHVWYFDLADGGSFHGVLAGDLLGPNGGYAGPFDGYKGYGESGIRFGPDDPEQRFLYMNVTDTGTFMRLDLEKRMVAACSGPPRNKTEPVQFIEQGAPNPTVSHVGPRWLAGGDFVMLGVLGRPNVMYRRVK